MSNRRTVPYFTGLWWDRSLNWKKKRPLNDFQQLNYIRRSSSKLLLQCFNLFYGVLRSFEHHSRCIPVCQSLKSCYLWNSTAVAQLSSNVGWEQEVKMNSVFNTGLTGIETKILRWVFVFNTRTSHSGSAELGITIQSGLGSTTAAL